jgi:PAS domain S-box-containing protein
VKDREKTKEQLINELAQLRQRMAELEASETERKQVEEALRESEAELFAVFNNAPIVMILVDRERRVRKANRGTLEFTGRPAEEIIGLRGGEALRCLHSLDDPKGCGFGSFCEICTVRNVVLDTFEIGRSHHRVEASLPFARGEKQQEELTFLVSTTLLSVPKDQMVLVCIEDITERKRVEEALRRRTAQLEALREVGLELTAQLDLDTLLHSIASRAIELLGGTKGGLYLYRPEQDVLEWAVAIGPDLAPTGAILHRGEGLSGRVWETGEPLIVSDYQHWEGKPALYEDYPWTAVLGVPVRWGEEFLGVLDVLADSPRIFSRADAELLGLLATQAAIAIQNARLFEREREQRELAEALEEAAATVSSTLDLEQVLDHILEQVERVVAGDAFSVILIQDDVARLARWRGYELPGEKIQPSRFDIPIAQYPNLMGMVQTGKPVVVLDTSVDSDWVPAARDQGWRRSYVGAPIRVGGVTVGFLNVSGTRPGQFSPEDARRLQAFASHAATAIGNARLYGEVEQELAERKRAEEALRESEDKYRQLFESESDAIFLIDNETGRILEANTAASALYEYSREELLGKKNSDLSAEPEETRRVTQTTPVIADQIVAIPLRSHRKKDGTVFPVEITGRFLVWRGRPVHIAAIRDITERRRMEGERERLVLELQEALTKVKTLSGLIPICANCKKIRDDEGFWNQLESYIQEHSEAVFSHSICPECAKTLYPEIFEADE